MTDKLIIAGLDTASDRWHVCSTSTKEGLRNAHFRSAVKNTDERRMELYDSARSFFIRLSHMHPGAHLFCEEPLALRNGKTTRVLSLAAGAIWAAHHDLDIYWFWVDVAHWKKVVVGNGNANKDTIREWCEANPGFAHQALGAGELERDPDFYDAYCLKLYGVRQIGA
jgi:hypothetical protein